jgi:hypothetical protein
MFSNAQWKQSEKKTFIIANKVKYAYQESPQSENTAPYAAK